MTCDLSSLYTNGHLRVDYWKRVRVFYRRWQFRRLFQRQLSLGTVEGGFNIQWYLAMWIYYLPCEFEGITVSFERATV